MTAAEAQHTRDITSHTNKHIKDTQRAEAEYKQRLQAANAQSAKLEAQIISKDGIVSRQRKLLDELNAKNDAVTDRYRRLSSDLDAARTDAETARNDLIHLRMTSSKEAKTHINVMQKLRGDHQTAMDEQTKTLARLRRAIEAARSDAARLADEVSLLNKGTARLAIKVQVYRRLGLKHRDKRDGMVGDLDAARREIDRYGDRLRSMSDKNLTLAVANSDISKNVVDKQHHVDRLEKANTELLFDLHNIGRRLISISRNGHAKMEYNKQQTMAMLDEIQKTMLDLASTKQERDVARKDAHLYRQQRDATKEDAQIHRIESLRVKNLLSSRKKDLNEEKSKHDITKDHLEEEKTSHITTKRKYEEEQTSHGTTNVDLDFRFVPCRFATLTVSTC